MTETHAVKDLQAPHIKPAKYISVAVALAVITIAEVSIALGNFLPKELVTVLLIGFSLTKAALVMLFYMHLKYDTKWYSLVLVFPLFMVTVLFIIVLIAAANWNII